MKIEFTLMNTLNEIGLTRAELAQLTGVRKNTIYDLCAGKTTRIHIDVVEKILNVLREHTGKDHGIDSVFTVKAEA